MNDEDALRDMTRLFIRMGADEARAEVMASQLLKRARQISVERGISFVEAAEDLLRKVIEARRGESPRTGSGTDGAGAPES